MAGGKETTSRKTRAPSPLRIAWLCPDTAKCQALVAAYGGVAAGEIDEKILRSGVKIVGLYQAPHAFTQQRLAADLAWEAGPALELWLRHYRSLLKLAGRHAAEITLINASRFDTATADALAEKIGAARPEAIATRFAWDHGDDRSRTVDWLAPEAWDLYEVLEGRALLAGRAADRRGAADPDDPLSCLAVAAEDWRRADAFDERVAKVEARQAEAAATLAERQQSLDDARAELQQREAQIATAAERYEELSAKLAATARERDSLRAELTETLTEQADLLTQLQTAADDAGPAQREAAAREAARQEVATLRDELAQVGAKLVAAEKQRDAGATEHDKIVVQLKAARIDNGLLLDQLNQVQDELERHYLENRRYEELVATTTETLTRSRRVLAGLLGTRAPMPPLAS